MISHSVPGMIPAALASSISMCISSDEDSVILTMVAPNKTALCHLIAIEMVCPSWSHKIFASAGLAWRCLCAIMSPWDNWIDHLGHMISIAPLFWRSPESLIGALVPSLKLSACNISICVSSLYGPRILTPSICPLGHLILTVSLQAYCHGWERSFIFSQRYPTPNTVEASDADKWICLLEIQIGVFFMMIDD